MGRFVGGDGGVKCQSKFGLARYGEPAFREVGHLEKGHEFAGGALKKRRSSRLSRL
ncbi:hypothetical protein ZHAS_00006757 [Anopheles sinensis]|uniref:Uncharacterized protein n=1 Tax=Anopheles sinensis TaxID=74873 RepID=A0A084VM51_ANOSI|nr:hypothetical protein ZHAS_00006757 [Anopheles sinensis]